MTSTSLPTEIARHTSHWLQGSPFETFGQFSDLARILAVDVLPTPRAPVNRYAWATRFEAMALRSAWAIISCPTTSPNDCGRKRRARTVYSMGNIQNPNV